MLNIISATFNILILDNIISNEDFPQIFNPKRDEKQLRGGF
jgi:hypothetical protein